MAEVRPELTEATLRETRDNLLGAVVEQQRRGGAGDELSSDPIGDLKAAEEFILPILRKVEVDHDHDRRKDMLRANAADRQQEALDVSHRRQAANLPEGHRLIDEQLGEYDVHLGTGKVTPVGNAWKPPHPKEGPATKAARRRFRMLAQMPEWKDRITSVFFAAKPQRWKDQQFKKILKDSVRLYGDPMKMDGP